MSLEFTAFDPNDPDLSKLIAVIPLQAHEYIMSKAHEYELELLCRMADHWQDAVYESGELQQLRGELSQISRQLIPHEPDSKRLADLLERMDAVINKAQEIGGWVEAIAD